VEGRVVREKEKGEGRRKGAENKKGD